MQQDSGSTATSTLAPVAARERIAALDIIRGLALLGIALMNVEWFTRPISELGRGIDPSLSGIDYTVSWLVEAFIQGKFWTLFSLLFGMGFAVMLGRAEARQSPFVLPYVRRIVGLLLFGVLHYILIWTGDILHNYAITALALLLIVTRSWKAWLAIVVSITAVGIAFKLEAMPMLLMFGALVGVLMFFLRRGNISRYWKWGVAVYSFVFVLGLIGAGAMATFPQLKPAEKPEQIAKREERKQERVKERAEEIRIYTQGTYVESVKHRAHQFAEDMPQAAGLSFLALPMFLIGFWFVRSGIVARLREHGRLFAKLFACAFPVGLAMTLTSMWLMPAPGADGAGGPNPANIAAGSLFQLGALGLCLGYFAAFVLVLNTRIGARGLSPLAYAGRMALTNYIGASIIGTWFFSGYGLGFWGQVSRPGQMLFVLVVFVLQLAFSAVWLRYFRYGPLEWAWRAVTYWQLPPMRRRGREGDAAFVAAMER